MPTKNRPTSGPILRGSQPYLILKEIGELGDKGKKVMSMGYRDKILAQDDCPLSSLVIPVLKECLAVVRYENKEAFEKDMAIFRDYLSRLRYDG